MLHLKEKPPAAIIACNFDFFHEKLLNSVFQIQLLEGGIMSPTLRNIHKHINPSRAADAQFG